MLKLSPVTHEAIDMASELGVDQIIFQNSLGSIDATLVPTGLNPSGEPSLCIGSWGINAQSRDHIMPISEWCVLLEGTVTITEAITGQVKTFGPGDAFLRPKGLDYRWDQGSRVRKFYVKCDHLDLNLPPTKVIAFNHDLRSRPARACSQDQTGQGWHFCDSSERLRKVQINTRIAPATPRVLPCSTRHCYFQDDHRQMSAGTWRCAAHATEEGRYLCHEFIFLWQGCVMLYVNGKSHVFVAGDGFFIPRGLVCVWDQPVDISACYVIFDPVEEPLLSML